MPKHFWGFVITVQLVIVLSFIFGAGVAVGGKLLLLSMVNDAVVLLLIWSRKSWRKFAGLEDESMTND
jgi:hypothetical protein